MAMDPDVSALTGYAGTYEKKLFSTLVNELNAQSDGVVVPNVKFQMNMSKLTVQKGAKPYSNDFTGSTADLTYAKRVLEVETGKRELQIDVEEYRNTYLSEVMATGINPKDLPFPAYTWDQVMKKLAAEINDDTAYLGVGQSGITTWATGSTYAVGDKVRFGNDYYICTSATSTGQSPLTNLSKWGGAPANARMIAKGWGTILAKELTDGNISATSIGSIASDTAKAQFDELARAMSPAYQKAGFNIYCSVDNAWKYNDDFENKVGKYVQINKNGYATLSGFGERVQIIPATWMGNSGRLIATPRENLIMATDAMSDLSKINIFPSDWTIKAGIAFRVGFNFRDLGAMKVSDVA
jgi:hypothetical protein